MNFNVIVWKAQNSNVIPSEERQNLGVVGGGPVNPPLISPDLAGKGGGLLAIYRLIHLALILTKLIFVKEASKLPGEKQHDHAMYGLIRTPNCLNR